MHTNYSHTQCPPRGRILSSSAQNRLATIYPLIHYFLIGTMGGLAVTHTVNKFIEIPSMVGDISLNTLALVIGCILGLIAAKFFHVR